MPETQLCEACRFGGPDVGLHETVAAIKATQDGQTVVLKEMRDAMVTIAKQGMRIEAIERFKLEQEAFNAASLAWRASHELGHQETKSVKAGADAIITGQRTRIAILCTTTVTLIAALHNEIGWVLSKMWHGIAGK